MEVPEFKYVEDEEEFVLKLHGQGFRVNYRKKDPDQLLFNRLYQKCAKRRDREGKPPMFGITRSKSLPHRPVSSSSEEQTEPSGSEKKDV